MIVQTFEDAFCPEWIQTHLANPTHDLILFRLMTFVNPSTLCRWRQRLGTEGALIVEDQVFTHLKRAAVIDADMMLMDTTVLESPIMYPTDVRLLYKAFDKMAALATDAKLDLWWDQPHVKQRWRAYNLHQKDRQRLSRRVPHLVCPRLREFCSAP